MNRCTQCILPHVYPGIEFDAQGVCNYCRSHRPIHYLGQKALAEKISHVPLKQGPYDCLVPISGGKDSTFVLLQMKKMFGLRILAFNYDNTLTHIEARENIAKTTKKLGIDLTTERNLRQRRYLQTNLRAFLHRPQPAMIPMFCTGCRYGIIGNAFKMARRYNIPMIAIGWSPIEDTPFKEAYLRQDGGSVVGGLLKNSLANPRYLKPDNLWAAIKDYTHNYSHIRKWDGLLQRLYPNIELIHFYDYIRYDPDVIQKTVQQELDWSTPQTGDSWQFDCQIKTLQNFFMDRLAHYTATSDYLSAMIREGLITRNEALLRLEQSEEKRQERLQQLFDFLTDLNAPDLVQALRRMARSPEVNHAHA
ncbi:hypothetical protein JW992_14655 [candidate division KSB1 bacterium]|nr:hypothetical protein [candidate division KSB1 bacterium]